mmetsp:Transcript_27848/g.41292  ORF Transcript_27848/g.41292 Transcript_27848/m.41292 type:complete len:106 (+) Transcript_27848:18-335(+)
MQGLIRLITSNFYLTGILHAISSLAVHITGSSQWNLHTPHSAATSTRRNPFIVSKSDLVAKLCEELALFRDEKILVLEMRRPLTFQLALDIKLWLVTNVLALVQI